MHIIFGVFFTSDPFGQSNCILFRANDSIGPLHQTARYPCPVYTISRQSAGSEIRKDTYVLYNASMV